MIDDSNASKSVCPQTAPALDKELVEELTNDIGDECSLDTAPTLDVCFGQPHSETHVPENCASSVFTPVFNNCNNVSINVNYVNK